MYKKKGTNAAGEEIYFGSDSTETIKKCLSCKREDCNNCIVAEKTKKRRKRAKA